METQTRLTGTDLLKVIKERKGQSKTEIAKACGYIMTTANGDERCQFTAFYLAVAEANGFDFTDGANPNGPGRTLSYSAQVLTTGAILIGPRYVQALGLEPGDRVSIATKTGKISLTPMNQITDDVEEAVIS